MWNSQCLKTPNVYNLQCLEPQLSKAPNLEEIKDAPHLVWCEAYSMQRMRKKKTLMVMKTPSSPLSSVPPHFPRH